MSPSIHIETAGCAFNVSDGEAMAGVLRRAGYDLVASQEAADLVVLNTCTVKDKTFRNFRRRLARIRGTAGRPVVVAGCIPKAHERSGLAMLDGVSTLGPDAVGRIDEVVRETLRGRIVHDLGEAGASRSALPTLRRNAAVEILPIARGCRSACAFCQTRLARGRLESFRPEEILAQARRALDEGVKIFWVTAQDVGAYGHDIGLPLPELIERIANIEGDFMIRVGMTSPQWVVDHLDGWVEAYRHPKVFKFLHVPLQSGSDRVLRDMRRDGGVAEFERIHEAFLARHPDLLLVTDLIAGFPTETEEDFQQTLDLVERLELGFVNCSKFSARPGTAAARLEGLSSAVVARRCKELMAAARKVAERLLDRRVGGREGVIVEQIGEGDRRVARTEAYRQVILDEPLEPGARLEARIVGREAHHLLGRFEDAATPNP